MYALAASAAGVSLLGSAQPALAKIVYTPTDRSIAPGTSYALDLNHDGTTDFTLVNYFKATTSGGRGTLYAQPRMAGDAIQGHVKSSALALRGGAIIGDKKSFLPGKAVMAWAFSFVATYGNGGNWVNVKNRYLGLRFKVDGKIHYGWARLSVTIFLSNITTALTGYAYETIPNKPIIAGETKGPEYDRVEQSHSETLTMPAPETASLGLLATGSRALSIWRRREGDALRS